MNSPTDDYILATSIDDIKRYMEGGSPDKFVGMDTETTGLDTRKAKIVGASLSVAAGSGIYIPLGHKIGRNLPIDGVRRCFEELGLGTEYSMVFYHAQYDLNILQANMGWYPENFQDALEVVYLEDPDRKQKGLKLVAKEDLGFDMTRFEDLFTPEEIKAKRFDISTKSPQRCTRYAGADADATLRIWRQKAEVREQQKFAIAVDTKLIEVVRRMEHNGGMVLNTPYIDRQMVDLEKRAQAMEEQIHRVVGYKFEIGSPKQLGIALFDKLGYPSPGLTKQGQHKTGAEDLEKLAQQYPVVGLVTSYRSVVKARSTYFTKLKRLANTGLPVRFRFNIFAAPTFRFAAPGGDPDVDGATGINIQAVSNGEAVDMMAVDLSVKGGSDEYLSDLDDGDLLFGGTEKEVLQATDLGDYNGDPATLPWVVQDESYPPKNMCFRETCDLCPAMCHTKGIDTTRRMQKNLKLVPSVRQSFQAPEGYVLLSFDYDRQELVIGANMSGEPAWLRALAKGEDLHAVTASAAYGMSVEAFQAMENNPDRKDEWSRKRGVGKILNFATFYGATAYTLARKADLSQGQADQIYENFKNGLRTLFQWIEKVHLFARKNGYTTTYFGRRRSLKEFYDRGKIDPKMKKFADRSSVNTAIQGTAAEVTRIAMVKCATAIKNKGWNMKQVRFVMQIHDELMFLVKEDMVKEVIPVIKEAMEFNVKSWTVQLTCAPKIGYVWGNQKEIKPDDLPKWMADQRPIRDWLEYKGKTKAWLESA